MITHIWPIKVILILIADHLKPISLVESKALYGARNTMGGTKKNCSYPAKDSPRVRHSVNVDSIFQKLCCVHAKTALQYNTTIVNKSYFHEGYNALERC